MPHQHQHFLTAQDFPYPPGSIPVASPRRRLIATPSRRRRIIYETARSTANLYVQHGIDKHIQEKGASTTIQSFIRRHVAERRFQTLLQRRNDASTIIQYRFRGFKRVGRFRRLIDVADSEDSKNSEDSEGSEDSEDSED